MGAQAREHCLAEFELDPVADRWDALIARLLSRP
jgi:hypothetical protein